MLRDRRGFQIKVRLRRRSAVRLQAWCRRCRDQTLFQRQRFAATRIQWWHRRLQAAYRRLQAASQIQLWYRRRKAAFLLGIHLVRLLLQTRDAAGRLQRVWRGSCARQRCRALAAARAAARELELQRAAAERKTSAEAAAMQATRELKKPGSFQPTVGYRQRGIALPASKNSTSPPRGVATSPRAAAGKPRQAQPRGRPEDVRGRSPGAVPASSPRWSATRSVPMAQGRIPVPRSIALTASGAALPAASGAASVRSPRPATTQPSAPRFRTDERTSGRVSAFLASSGDPSAGLKGSQSQPSLHPQSASPCAATGGAAVAPDVDALLAELRACGLLSSTPKATPWPVGTEGECGASDLDSVRAWLSSALPSSEVRTVLRVECQLASAAYSAVVEALGPERMLWHGTSWDSIANIARHGFNRAYSGRHGSKLGRGTYFAEDPNYALRFCGRGTPTRAVFLGGVLSGRCCKGAEGFIEPPADENGVRYDSTVDDVERPRVFCVFRDFQALPMYVAEVA